MNQMDSSKVGEKRSIDLIVEGKNLNVSYQRYSATILPKKATVFYFCGGPGVPCVGVRPLIILADFDVVTMDYLGIGQNRDYQEPQLMAIDAQAEAATAIANSLGDSNIILFGQSFGTTVATATAAKLTDLNYSTELKSKLRGVLLDGVVAKAGTTDYEKGYIDTANTAWKMLRPTEQKKFKNSYINLVSTLYSGRKKNSRCSDDNELTIWADGRCAGPSKF